MGRVSAVPSRIAVFRALQLGDMLCAIPAVRALRRSAPGASLTLIGLPWAASFATRFPHLFDDFVSFPGYPGLPEREPDLGCIPDLLTGMQARHFDLVIQMHGSGGITNPLACAFGGRKTAGYYEPGAFCPDPETFMPYPHGLPEVERHIKLVEFLGIEADGDHLEFPISDDERASVRERFDLDSEPWVCLHPGSRFPSRRWPPERFAAVGDWLAARGYRVLLTGSASEAKLTAAVAGAMTAPSTDLAGRTDLGELAALIEGAVLLLCNDTGVSHVAAALDTPSVVVSCGSDAARWAPLDRERHRVIAHDVPCRPCEFVDCPVPGHPCATRVMARQALDEAARILGALPIRLPGPVAGAAR